MHAIMKLFQMFIGLSLRTIENSASKNCSSITFSLGRFLFEQADSFNILYQGWLLTHTELFLTLKTLKNRYFQKNELIQN